MNYFVITWDWKEDPDIESIDQALKKFKRPAVTQVDTGGDCHGVVVCERSNAHRAQELFDKEMEELSK